MSEQDRYDHRQTVGEYFSRNYLWRIPVYQRHYAWEEDAETKSGPIDLFWETVEKQTCARLKGETPPPHYLGSVLVDNKTDLQSNDRIDRYYDVVDGQQRLTTIQIALLALIWVMDDEKWGDDSWREGIKEEVEKYVFSAKNKPRLRPTNFDLKQFQKIVYDSYDIIPDIGGQKSSRDNANKSKIVLTHDFFKGKYAELVHKNLSSQQETVDAIKKTLTEGFDIVLIILKKEDEAQLIFESLNNFAKPLTTFDLIRNNVFYRAANIEQDKDVKLFNTEKWQSLEDSYWGKKADQSKNKGSTHIEAYVARMLVAKMQKEILFNRNSIFKTYKEFSDEFSKKDLSIDEEIASLVEYVDIYRSLDEDKEKSYYGVFYYDIWKNRDFYPVVFSIERSNVSAEEKQRMLRLLESYVIRRSVCGLSLKPYNKHAASICGAFKGEPTYKKMNDALKDSEKDTALFPSDERVKKDSVNIKFYGSPFQRYMFEQIEESMRKDKGEFDLKKGVLTIDHILPQKWSANEGWKRILLGDDDSRHKIEEWTINPYIDTIGNLTLMSQLNNSIKSNRSFDEVKILLRDSLMTMNRELANEETWNIETIRERSKELADIICKLWPYDIE